MGEIIRNLEESRNLELMIGKLIVKRENTLGI